MSCTYEQLLQSLHATALELDEVIAQLAKPELRGMKKIQRQIQQVRRAWTENLGWRKGLEAGEAAILAATSKEGLVAALKTAGGEGEER